MIVIRRVNDSYQAC